MHNIKLIRDEPQLYIGGLIKRAYKADSVEKTINSILALENDRRAKIKQIDNIRSQLKDCASERHEALSNGADQAVLSALEMEVVKLKADLVPLEEKLAVIEVTLQFEMSTIPNVPLLDVPAGADETGNVEVRKSSTPIKEFKFKPKEHYELGEALGLLDFENAVRMSGSRFSVLKGQLAQLERALGQFMLDTHVNDHGYEEHNVPLLVKQNAMYGTGQLPKFEDDLFKTTDGRYLIPTSEVSLTNMVADQIVDTKNLPLRMTALTACFRSEAGSAGRDVRGILRQHQFSKVELVSIVTSDMGYTELERMTKCAEKILDLLGLSYRTMMLCAGDMGFSARKTYDIEVWLPGQNKYREISSCSLCGDFQARRMNTRHKTAGIKGTEFVHTLNGSGIAVGRALIAVLENYQNEDGSITIPPVLRSYMGGRSMIENK